MNLPPLTIRIGADFSAATKAFRDLEKQTAGLTARLQSVGRTLTAAVSLPIAGLGIAATKVAIDFETAFAGVEKTVNGTAAEIEGLRTGIQEMARRLPASTTEIAAVAEAAGQLGIETGSILSFTETMIGLGEATNLSADQAATSLARLANITGLPQSQFSNLGSAVVDLGNNFATTEAEIVELGLRLAGAGKIVGLTEGQILGLGAALSSVGIDAEAGGTALSKVLIQIREAADSGGAELSSFARISGVTATEFQNLVKNSPADAVAAFIEGLGRIEASGGSATQTLSALGIVEARMRDALLRTAGAGDLVARAFDTGTTAFQANTALADEVAKRYATLASRLEVVRNRLTAALLPLGEVFATMIERGLPAIEGLLDRLRALAEGFQALDPAAQKIILGIAALAAAIGPLLIAMGTLGATAPFIAGGFALMLGPIGLTVTALAALGAAFAAAYVRSERVREATGNLAGSARTLGGQIADVARGVADLFGKVVSLARGLETARDKMLGINEEARDTGPLSGFAVVIGQVDLAVRGLNVAFRPLLGVLGLFIDRTREAVKAASDLAKIRVEATPGGGAFFNPFAFAAQEAVRAAQGAVGNGRTPTGIVPTDDSDADKVRTLADVFSDLAGTIKGVAAAVQVGLIKPTDAAAERAQVMRAAFEEALSINKGTLTPQIQALGEAAARAADAAKVLGAIEVRPTTDFGSFSEQFGDVRSALQVGDAPERLRDATAAYREMTGAIAEVQPVALATLESLSALALAGMEAVRVAALAAASALADGLANAFADLISLQSSFADFGRAIVQALQNVVAQIVRTIAQAVILAGILAVLFPGSSGSFGASFFSLIQGGSGLPGSGKTGGAGIPAAPGSGLAGSLGGGSSRVFDLVAGSPQIRGGFIQIPVSAVYAGNQLGGRELERLGIVAPGYGLGG